MKNFQVFKRGISLSMCVGMSSISAISWGSGKSPTDLVGANSQLVYKVYVAPTLSNPIQINIQDEDGNPNFVKQLKVNSEKFSDLLMNQLAETSRFQIITLKQEFPNNPGLLVIQPTINYFQMNAVSGQVEAGISQGLISQATQLSGSGGVSFKANEIGMDFKILNCAETDLFFQGAETNLSESCLLVKSIHVTKKGWTWAPHLMFSWEDMANFSASFQSNTSVQKTFVELFQKAAQKLMDLNVFYEAWEGRVVNVEEAKKRLQMDVGTSNGVRVGDQFEVIERFCGNSTPTAAQGNSLIPVAVREASIDQCSAIPLARVQVVAVNRQGSLAKIDQQLSIDEDLLDGFDPSSITPGAIIRPVAPEKNRKTSPSKVITARKTF